MKNNNNSDNTTNRYTRLRSIKEFGYDVDWDLLFSKSVTIAGVGGLGMVAAEMLARCGIGKLYLFDKDIVDVVNLNRMGFDQKDINIPKVEVIKKRISEVNSDTEVHVFHGDIMLFENEDNFINAVKNSDVVIMGVDNYPARSFVNQICINHKTVLVDGGASRSALSGHVHPIIPGNNACMQCTGFIPGAERPRGEVCIASLPTTMSIIASIQVQETLKYLLNFGTLVDYLSYNAITGQFSHHRTKRDKNCPACSKLPTSKN